MPLDSYQAYLTIAKQPKEDFRSDYQEIVDDLFYASSDWYTVQEETVYASGVYNEIDVRINNVVMGRTGMPQGDDYKVLLFKDIDHEVALGYMYIFDSNYWIVINVTKKSSLQTSATVRRCNNMLRWITSDGGYYEQPCVIDYGIKENRDYATAGSKVVLASGLLRVTTQLNERTNTIKPTKRFLFGNRNNWTGYIVMGGGIENYNNLVTDDISTLSGYLVLTMNANFVNPEQDDVINGIAEYNQNVYTLSITDNSISGVPSDEIQLYASILFNGTGVSRDVTWASSDTDIATVDSNGLVTLVSNGSCTITCTLDNNTGVYDTCDVDVFSAPHDYYQVVIEPITNYILEGQTQEFVATLYLNGSALPDIFTFNMNSGSVPQDNFTFTVIDGNTFSIKNNERYLLDVLTVECVSGVYSKSIEVLLKGAW